MTKESLTFVDIKQVAPGLLIARLASPWDLARKE